MTDTHAPDVCGCMAKNWTQQAPALQINPAASLLDLLGWCYGEVDSLRAAASAFGMAECELTANDMNAIFHHRLAPLEAVLEHAINQLATADGVRSSATFKAMP